MSLTAFLLIVAALGVAYAALYYAMTLVERAMWNAGVCRVCDAPWRGFDVDSTGAIGYACKCDGAIWLSYYRPTTATPAREQLPEAQRPSPRKDSSSACGGDA